MRHAFNETFKGEYTRSFKMVDPTLTANCAADLDALKQSGALAEDFHDRALPLGCMVPDDIRDKIEEDGSDLSDVLEPDKHGFYGFTCTTYTYGTCVAPRRICAPRTCPEIMAPTLRWQSLRR